jgi:hypothetical protein
LRFCGSTRRGSVRASRGGATWSYPKGNRFQKPPKQGSSARIAKGASLKDPTGLFNSSLDGNARRAIDFHEGDKIDEKALKALIRAAVALNMSVRAAKA